MQEKTRNWRKKSVCSEIFFYRNHLSAFVRVGDIRCGVGVQWQWQCWYMRDRPGTCKCSGRPAEQSTVAAHLSVSEGFPQAKYFSNMINSFLISLNWLFIIEWNHCLRSEKLPIHYLYIRVVACVCLHFVRQYLHFIVIVCHLNINIYTRVTDVTSLCCRTLQTHLSPDRQ